MTVAGDLLAILGPVAFTMFVVLNLGGILTWVERKQSAIMQDRIGANRASIFGSQQAQEDDVRADDYLNLLRLVQHNESAAAAPPSSAS